VDTARVLATFDEQMRRCAADLPGAEVERDEHVTRVLGGNGWSGVIWSDLPDDADDVIEAQIRHFAAHDLGWEWKHYSHDRPPDLPTRLLAAGFVPDEVESLLVAEIEALTDEAVPPEVALVPVTDPSGVDAMVAVHDEVFGGDNTAIARAVLAGLAAEPSAVAAVVAVADGVPIAAGRVEFPAQSDFASLWGGGTVSAWRGRGVFRAMVGHRAALARDRGYRYLQVDASTQSRPILEGIGFVELARTTPFRYTPKGAPGRSR
jgi:GNAT superfamily N-acetyltransferase